MSGDRPGRLQPLIGSRGARSALAEPLAGATAAPFGNRGTVLECLSQADEEQDPDPDRQQGNERFLDRHATTSSEPIAGASIRANPTMPGGVPTSFGPVPLPL
ncbi:MAG TPA: hypothetical protein VFO18_14450 [Methylomirabilota bacterium]|nr:hypothetical protein [Methylomirabilota bacterium]